MPSVKKKMGFRTDKRIAKLYWYRTVLSCETCVRDLWANLSRFSNTCKPKNKKS